jgi:hypothetical protein
MSPEVFKRLLFAISIIAALAVFGGLVGPTAPWFVASASFCMLGLLDLARPFCLLRMPGSLREIRPAERRGGLYRALGVRAFGTLLRRKPLRLLNRRVYLGAGSRDLTSVFSQLEHAEAAHFWSSLLPLPYLAHAATQGWWRAFVVVVLFDLVVNVYPILHLRSARTRLEWVLQRPHAAPFPQ